MFNFKRFPIPLVFVLFWTAFMLFLDAKLGPGFIRAVRSADFPTAPGTVTKSEIAWTKRRKPRLVLEYIYTVNGQEFVGTHYHVEPQLVGNPYWLAAHDAHPVGSAATVYFDPDDPGRAVLRPGFRADSLLLMLALTPFNLIMIGLWWARRWRLADRREFDPALARSVREVPGGWRVRPTIWSGFVQSTFLAFLLITFVGSWLGGAFLVLSSVPAGWWLPVMMWSVALTAAPAFGFYWSQRALIQLNEQEGTITLAGRWKRITLNREQVRGITITTEQRTQNNQPWDASVVTLHWRGDLDEEQSARLATFADPADANSFTVWLGERLGLPLDERQRESARSHALVTTDFDSPSIS